MVQNKALNFFQELKHLDIYSRPCCSMILEKLAKFLCMPVYLSKYVSKYRERIEREFIQCECNIFHHLTDCYVFCY